MLKQKPIENLNIVDFSMADVDFEILGYPVTWVSIFSHDLQMHNINLKYAKKSKTNK